MRVRVWFLAALASHALFGCAPSEGTRVFALVPKAMNNPFFDQARDGCKRAETELEAVECLYIGPGEHTELEQVQIVEDLITRRVDGIAISPSNAPAIAKVLSRAKAAGIPVLTWDSDLLERDRALRATYIGTRNRDIGVEQARILMSRKPEGGRYCIQSGGPAAANHNERIAGIRETLRGAWTEAAGCPLYSNDDFPLAVRQMEDIFAREPDLAAFVVTGGFPQFAPRAYRQVAETYADRIRSEKTLIVVADTLSMQMELLADGLSHGQVGQRPFEMGRRAMHVLRDLADGKPADDPIHTGLDVCLQENARVCLGH